MLNSSRDETEGTHRSSGVWEEEGPLCDLGSEFLLGGSERAMSGRG